MKKLLPGMTPSKNTNIKVNDFVVTILSDSIYRVVNVLYGGTLFIVENKQAIQIQIKANEIKGMK